VTALLVLVGGAVGAVLRYLTAVWLPPRHEHAFPWATFAVNVAGSLLLGATAGAVAATDGPGWVSTVVGAGFCGALTTFSTFGFKTVRLLEEGRLETAAVNVSASLVGGLLAFVGARELAAAAL